MIRVGYICGCAYDATSLYRAVGPFQEIAAYNEEIRFIELKEISWHTLGFIDVLFMQRPYEKTHIEVLMKVKKLGIPIWLDYDDDLLAVPTDNPAYDVYSKPETKAYYLKCLSMANIVTFSTETLRKSAQEASKITINSEVIPNAFNDYLFKRDNKIKGKDPIIMWRGSATHVGDLFSVKEDIKLLAEKYPDFTWMFLGQVPWMLRDIIKSNRILHIPIQEPIDYMALLNNVNPEILIAPLVDSPFNQAKSNIAWQEATIANAVCVAPSALPEFDRPGVYGYDNETGQGFFKVVSYLLDQPAEYKQLAVDKSWGHITSNLMLSKINRGREKIIERLSKLRPKQLSFSLPPAGKTRQHRTF